MLNKLHFDFRNAKPAFLGVSFSKLGDVGKKSSVKQMKLGCCKSTVQAGSTGNQADAVNDNGAEDSIVQLVAGSAVQVDDGDSEGLVDMPDAAVVPHDLCSVFTTSEPLGTDSTSSAVTTQYIECTEQLQPICSAPEHVILRPSDASVCLSVNSSQCQLSSSEQTDFPHHKKSVRRSKRTERTAAENQTAVRLADGIVLKPLSVVVNESFSCKDSVAVAVQSANHSTVESSGSGGCWSNSPIVLYDDDDLDDMTLTKRVRAVQSVSGVKKSLKSENAHSLRNVTATGIKLEPKCKGGKLKVVRITKRRRRKRHDSEDEIWFMQKKLLIMPDDNKFMKSGCGGKQKVRRNSSQRVAKSKRRKSVSVEGMELPDLSTKLDNGAAGADMSDLLKVYDVEPEEDSTLTRKWYVDVTGADLDIDYKSPSESNDHKKYLFLNKAAEQNVSELLPKCATEPEYCHTTFSSSQETPPPSVASSDSSSLCGEPDQSVNSNVEDAEMLESADTKWLTIYTKLARYIDGRHFDRLVNGVTVQVSATMTDEAVVQFGQECVPLIKLTKYDIKELQDQVRLEEIYHRRVKKANLSVHDYSRKNVKCRSSPRRYVPGFVRRSAMKCATRSQRTVGSSNETGTAEAVAESQQQDVSFFAYNELHQVAAVSDADTVPHLSSGDSDVEESRNLICKPGGLYTGELSKGDEAADYDYISIGGTKQWQSDTMVIGDTAGHTSAANQSQMLGQVCESAPTGVIFHKHTSTMNISAEADECEPVAIFVSPDKCLDVATDDVLLSNSFGLTDNHSAADNNGIQRATMDDVATTAGAAGTDNSEYIAAVALASLSVAAESQLHSARHLLSPESGVSTDTMRQSNDQHKSSQRATDNKPGTSKPADRLLLQHLAKQSEVIETVTIASSVQPSKHTSASSGQRLKNTGDRRGHRVSTTDKQRECSSRAVGDSVNECTRGVSSKQRSHGHKSYFVRRTAGHQNPVEADKTKLPTTHSSKSTVNFDSGLSCVATSSTDKKNTESSGTATVIFQKSTVSDKAKCTSESSDSREMKMVDHRKRKQVAGGSCDSVSSLQPLIGSSHSVTDVSIGELDLPARGDNALLLGDTAVTISASGSASATALCSSSSPSLLSHSSPPHNLIYSIIKRSDKGTKISLRLQRTGQSPSSLTMENTHVEEKNGQVSEMVTGTTTTIFRGLNSNSVSKSSSEMLPSSVDTNTVASVDAVTDVSLPAITAGETIPHSCSVAENLLQLPVVVMDNFTPDSPAFPYREPEDIRSPSPVHGDILVDDHAGGIRSPSPCDLESPQEVFHVIETSWDVRLSSPCEIQSPDVSDDEANDSIKQFNGHCNVCFQHGPLTIPLNMEETVPHNGP